MFIRLASFEGQGAFSMFDPNHLNGLLLFQALSMNAAETKHRPAKPRISLWRRLFCARPLNLSRRGLRARICRKWQLNCRLSPIYTLRRPVPGAGVVPASPRIRGRGLALLCRLADGEESKRISDSPAAVGACPARRRSTWSLSHFYQFPPQRADPHLAGFLDRPER